MSRSYGIGNKRCVLKVSRLSHYSERHELQWIKYLFSLKLSSLELNILISVSFLSEEALSFYLFWYAVKLPHFIFLISSSFPYFAGKINCQLMNKEKAVHIFKEAELILWDELSRPENPPHPTYARHTETLDSCFDLITSLQQCIP